MGLKERGTKGSSNRTLRRIKMISRMAKEEAMSQPVGYLCGYITKICNELMKHNICI